MIIPPLSPPGSPTGADTKYGEWHLLKLGGQVMPGKWRVVGGAIRLKEDPKRKAGVDGANPVFHGLDPQPFEIEGEQYTDDERNRLAQILATTLPQPGASQNQFPQQLQHPSIMHFGFGIAVHVLGAGIMEVVAPSITRVRIFLRHYLPVKPSSGAATNAPTRSINNTLRQKREQQNPSNPLPTTQPGIAGPPTGFKPGQ